MTAVAELQEQVRVAAAEAAPLRIAGAGRWLTAGRPVSSGATLSLASCSGVVDYVPGDLTITVQAGTTLAEIQSVAGEQGQWLPLDPFGGMAGTIGATVATGSSGPLAHGFGPVRDLVLGVEFIMGDARVARGGGRVVKNVAGFDLVRLVTGSWGTLGVITELTLRLHSLPGETATLAVEMPYDARRLAERLAAISAAPATPFAVELLNAALAERLGLARHPLVVVRLGGNPAKVAAEREALTRLGAVHEAPDEPWSRLSMEDEETAVVRLSCLPARVAEVWERVRLALEQVPEALLSASPARGIIRCLVPAETPGVILRGLFVLPGEVSVVPERLSSQLWHELAPTVIGDRVSQAIRARFDPAGILNPGILGPVAA